MRLERYLSYNVGYRGGSRRGKMLCFSVRLSWLTLGVGLGLLNVEGEFEHWKSILLSHLVEISCQFVAVSWGMRVACWKQGRLASASLSRMVAFVFAACCVGNIAVACFLAFMSPNSGFDVVKRPNELVWALVFLGF